MVCICKVQLECIDLFPQSLHSVCETLWRFLKALSMICIHLEGWIEIKILLTVLLIRQWFLLYLHNYIRSKYIEVKFTSTLTHFITYSPLLYLIIGWRTIYVSIKYRALLGWICTYWMYSWVRSAYECQLWPWQIQKDNTSINHLYTTNKLYSQNNNFKNTKF